MYSCYVINFKYFYNDIKPTLKEAITYGRSKGFEFSVWEKGKIVGHCTGVSLNWIPVKE